jgi:DNA-binding NarL/FixJ family response regulator
VTAIRVLLADDQELVRAGLRMMIDRAAGLTVVAEASTGTEAVRLAREARADVVLMDIRMPGLDGLSATRRITAEENLAGVKVLILTTFEVDEYVFEALRSGASGFLGKGARPDVLIEAIRTVARGDALLSPAATRGLIARYLEQHEPTDGAPGAPGSALVETLTDREREVVRLIAEGMSNTEIADQLSLSPLTVKTHANHAMTKVGARDRAQLVVMAYQTGLARSPARAKRVLPDGVAARRPRRNGGPKANHVAPWGGAGEATGYGGRGDRARPGASGDGAADRAVDGRARHRRDRDDGRAAALVPEDVGGEQVVAGPGRAGWNRRVR